MFLAVIILVGAGLYVLVKKKVQASSSLVIQGRPAQQIGIVLIVGGLLPVVLPMLLGKLGLVRDFVSGLILAIAIMFASLVCVAVIALREKRRQADKPLEPVPGDRSNT